MTWGVFLACPRSPFAAGRCSPVPGSGASLGPSVPLSAGPGPPSPRLSLQGRTWGLYPREAPSPWSHSEARLSRAQPGSDRPVLKTHSQEGLGSRVVSSAGPSSSPSFLPSPRRSVPPAGPGRRGVSVSPGASPPEAFRPRPFHAPQIPQEPTECSGNKGISGSPST